MMIMMMMFVVVVVGNEVNVRLVDYLDDVL
jgi:hypothetical protein